MTRAQPLFRSISSEGTIYLLVIEGNERWTIRQNGGVIASGPTDEDGIIDAIMNFRALPAATPRRMLPIAS